MISEKYYYLKAGKASDLADPKERRIYRFLEIFPGALAWGTLALLALLSWFAPVFIAFFIIAFDLYWFLKTVYLSLHLRSAFKKMMANTKVDWLARLKSEKTEWPEYYHLVILPFYKEGWEIIDHCLRGLLSVNYP